MVRTRLEGEFRAPILGVRVGKAVTAVVMLTYRWPMKC
jgi:hypothetical protein